MDNVLTLFNNYLNDDLFHLDDYMRLQLDCERLSDYLSTCYDLPGDHPIWQYLGYIDSGIADETWNQVEHDTKKLIELIYELNKEPMKGEHPEDEFYDDFIDYYYETAHQLDMIKRDLKKYQAKKTR